MDQSRSKSPFGIRQIARISLGVDGSEKLASLIPLAPIAEERHAPHRVQGRLLLMTEVYAGIFANL
jgi:hypothetical protein